MLGLTPLPRENEGGAFWKFMAPCDHGCYRYGDSWVEVIGFTKEEFRTSFDRIGVRYKSKTEYRAAEQSGEAFKRGDVQVFYAS